MPWKCAHGDAPPAEMLCSSVVELGVADTNTVRIKGHGTILSFGDAPVSSIDGSGVPTTVTVIFLPDEGEEIVLEGERVVTLSGKERRMSGVSFGSYSCNAAGDWTENGFWETGERETSRRLDLLEERLAKLEKS